MLPRLFLLLLLAFSLVSGREWTPVEAPTTAAEVLDVEASGDAAVMLASELAAPPPLVVERAELLDPPIVVHPSPDLGRVFRPPRLLGS